MFVSWRENEAVGSHCSGSLGLTGSEGVPNRRVGGRVVGFVAISMVVIAGSLPGSAQSTSSTESATTTEVANQESTTSETAESATTETSESTTSSTEAESTTSSSEQETTTSSTEAESTTATDASTTSTTAADVEVADRVRVEAAETQKAREVDAANAQLDELTAALATLQGDVTSQAAQVDIAARRLTEAQATAEALESDVAELEALVADLEFGLSDQAIRSFMGGELNDSLLAVGNDPTRAIRKQSMLAKATQTDVDYVANLSAAREDLRARRVDAEAALASAEAFQATTEEALRALEDDQAAQIRLTAAAESRLDHLLSERAALERLGADLDAGVDASATQALVNQLANAPLPAPSTVNNGSGDTLSQLDIRNAGKGIEVHVDIVEDIRQLLIDAAADGVDLAGGGYRDPATQIAVRKNNCGTSYYAIYEMPSSQCRPPTARPGRSMHEQGKAIDFTYNGKLITSRSGAGWIWLRDNAVKYGLYNLPSEPWHWSVNGR